MLSSSALATLARSFPSDVTDESSSVASEEAAEDAPIKTAHSKEHVAAMDSVDKWLHAALRVLGKSVEDLHLEGQDFLCSEVLRILCEWFEKNFTARDAGGYRLTRWLSLLITATLIYLRQVEVHRLVPLA